MKKLLITSLLLANMTSLLLAETKKLSIGVGLVGSINKLYRADKEVMPIPMINARYNRIYLNGIDIGLDIIKYEKLALSIFADLFDGYSIKGKDMDRGYKSIVKRKSQVSGGVKITYDIDPTFQGSASINGGEHGAKANLKLSKIFPITEKLYLVASISGNYYSNDYSDYYWGIDKDELGGKITKTFTPNDIYSIKIDIATEYYMTQNFSVISFISSEKFSSEIKKSPIIENSYMINAGVGMKYHF
ncbi:MipA/OmpV family protein [Fusobacterium sp. PH5-44]|uniref:MipA/OmpV family protein n=1 Tax=unclassified Fusobacterium TaxID=2648384 RepID=UPI003D21496B